MKTTDTDRTDDINFDEEVVIEDDGRDWPPSPAQLLWEALGEADRG